MRFIAIALSGLVCIAIAFGVDSVMFSIAIMAILFGVLGSFFQNKK